jgi:hypothetical protein
MQKMALFSKHALISNGSSLMQKGWLDFRNGHSVYLSFILTFMNSILIAYHFAITQFAFMNNIFYSVGLFALFFLGLYIPASVIIGYWHRRHQWSAENEALLQENWVWAWIARYQIRLIEGKATDEESKQVINYLEAILQRQKNGTSLMGNNLNKDSASSAKESFAKELYSIAQSQVKKPDVG